MDSPRDCFPRLFIVPAGEPQVIAARIQLDGNTRDVTLLIDFHKEFMAEFGAFCNIFAPFCNTL